MQLSAHGNFFVYCCLFVKLSAVEVAFFFFLCGVFCTLSCFCVEFSLCGVVCVWGVVSVNGVALCGVACVRNSLRVVLSVCGVVIFVCDSHANSCDICCRRCGVLKAMWYVCSNVTRFLKCGFPSQGTTFVSMLHFPAMRLFQPRCVCGNVVQQCVALGHDSYIPMAGFHPRLVWR